MQFKLLVASPSLDRGLDLCARVIEAAGDAKIAAEAVELRGVAGRAAAYGPDVLLLEPAADDDLGTSEVLSRLSQVSGATRVLVLCGPCSPAMITGFIQRGVCGCLASSSAAALIAKAVLAVQRGETWFSRKALMQALLSQLGAAEVTLHMADAQLLTAREQEVLGLIGGALSNKEIARRLRISDKTVKTHLHHIYVKLHRSGRYKAFLSNVAPDLQ